MGGWEGCRLLGGSQEGLDQTPPYTGLCPSPGVGMVGGGAQGASRAAEGSRVELFSPDQISCHCDFSGKHSLSPPKTSCPQQTVAFSNCEVGVLWAALSPPEALASHPDPVALIGSLSGPACGCPLLSIACLKLLLLSPPPWSPSLLGLYTQLSLSLDPAPTSHPACCPPALSLL